MAGAKKEGLELPWQALLIAVPALIIFHLNDQLLNRLGAPSNVHPALSLAFDGHLESAARLGVLSTFLLFVGVAVAAVTALGMALWTLSPSSRSKIGVGVVVLTLVAALTLWVFPTRGMPDDIGQSLFCAALHHPDEPVAAPAADRKQVLDPVLARAEWNKKRLCRAPSYTRLLWLLSRVKDMLVAATAALVFGTICCLAVPASPPKPAGQAALLKRQAERLNVFLYISAMLMVSALLFQGAFIRWPRFALAHPASFDAHVSSIIFYYGVGYSVFLASFYLPVALWLGSRAGRLGTRQLQDEVVRAARAGPAAIIKIGATILAPALVGLLNAFVELPG